METSLYLAEPSPAHWALVVTDASASAPWPKASSPLWLRSGPAPESGAWS
ncbi:hypothetical protein [Nonomuraea dietziae]